MVMGVNGLPDDYPRDANNIGSSPTSSRFWLLLDGNGRSKNANILLSFSSSIISSNYPFYISTFPCHYL